MTKTCCGAWRPPVLLLASVLAFAALPPHSAVSAGAVWASLGCDDSAYAKNFLRAAQRALTENELDPGPADGFWGPRTRDALMAFQTRHQLPATAQFTQATVNALFGAEAGITVSEITLPIRQAGEEVWDRQRRISQIMRNNEADILIIRNLAGLSAEDYEARCGRQIEGY